MLERRVLTLNEEEVAREAEETALNLLDRARSRFGVKFPFEEFIK